MKRMDFLKTSAIGLTVPKAVIDRMVLNNNTNNPIILSTWEHGRFFYKTVGISSIL